MIKEIVKQLYLSSRIGNKKKMAPDVPAVPKKSSSGIQSDFFRAPTSLWVHLGNPNDLEDPVV